MAIVVDTGGGSGQTYLQLQGQVADWMNRPSLAARIPDFIRLAEERIGRKLRVSGMVMWGTLAAVPGSREIALPDDFAEFKALQANGKPLLYKTPEALFEDGDSANRYTLEGRKLILGAIPAAAYDIDVRYYAIPPRLSGSTATNWLLDSAPSLYLYGALIEGALYVKNPKEASDWSTLFQGVVDELELQDRMAMVSGSSLVVEAR